MQLITCVDELCFPVTFGQTCVFRQSDIVKEEVTLTAGGSLPAGSDGRADQECVLTPQVLKLKADKS